MEGIEHPGRDAKTGFDNVNRFSEQLERYLGEAKDRNKPIGIVYVGVSIKAPADVPRVVESINELVREGKTPDEIVHCDGHFYLTLKIASEKDCKTMQELVAARIGQHRAIGRTGYVLIQPNTKASPQQIISDLEKLSSVA